MPWEERTVEKSRTEFMTEVLAEEKSMSQICREYKITRKTGYKWKERALKGEPLTDKRAGFKTHPKKTSAEVERIILDERIRHPAWGARKLKRYLEDHGYTQLPVQSTICEILKRNGYITPEDSSAHTPYIRFEKDRPNDMWQMDFKGDFALLNAQRCYPLTVLDDHSRFSICLEAKENQQGINIFENIKLLFSEYGLPDSILCDNGPPWGDSKSGSITEFDVWMMQLGILPIHCRPKHPQTQGKDERFHRTLIDEVLKRELFADIPAAQLRFKAWRYEYNYERPHDALELNTPSKRYKASKRKYLSSLKEPDYDDGVNLRKVNCKGYVSIQSQQYYLSEALIGKYLEIKPISDNEVGIYYGFYRIAKINLDECFISSKKVYRRGAEK